MDRPTAQALFTRHHLSVFRFLRRMTGSADVAEDLTQEVFVRVVRGLEAYVPRDRDLPWLFRIARRLLLDRHRSEKTSIEIRESAGVEDAPRAPRQDAVLAVDEALNGLVAADREAFLLREQFGLGYEEIAELTEATPDAVRNRIYRARRTLRRALAPNGSRAGGASSPEVV